ncbi:MAG TPA: YifB family Mg chelatase-like AAA ATPase [Acidimicrobiia bacterium]|nr:YifB family Mg chelatase-like AAA ATPase [Acidimicrobiia bacterium]
MLAAVRSATLLGIDGQVVTVEVHVSKGLPGFSVVGLPDAAGRESRERVRAALLSSGLSWPLQRITVNLAPAGVRKSGSGLELAVAAALLGADDQLPAGTLDGLALLGELALDGSVRPVAGTLALVDALAAAGTECVIVPPENAAEAALVPGVHVRVARNVGELRACLKGEAEWPDPPPPESAETDDARGELLDLADVRGLGQARLALAAAAAGGHHLLLVGPPGAGKTMLARRITTILPPLATTEALEVTRIQSAAGLRTGRGLATNRPFRAPHHTASVAALVGGGSPRPRPGEITLAHRGVLFLDELAEFRPSALDALRQPLEEQQVHLSRAAVSLTFPAQLLLLACCNPCPCGLALVRCRCSDVQRARYQRRLSAPLLDRFDLRLAVGATNAGAPPGPPSSEVREQVRVACERQRHRLARTPWHRNAEVPGSALTTVMPLPSPVAALWRDLCDERRLTGRGAARIHRVARTLADLDDRATVTAADVHTAADLREEVL